MDKITFIKDDFQNIPNFVRILYNILKDNKYSNIIDWDEDGENIIILNIDYFTDYIIPEFFRHKNLSSFIRQLNLYGFKKINEGKNVYKFRSKYFKRDMPEIWKFIKRKKSIKCLNYEDLQKMSEIELKTELQEVNELLNINKYKIDDLNTKNKSLIEDNKVLLFEILNTKKDLEITMENIFKYIYFPYNDNNSKNDENNKNSAKTESNNEFKDFSGNFNINDNIFKLENNK